MSAPLRLLFDECCSKRLPRELFEFYRIDHPDMVLRHLMENFAPGTPDPDWLAPLREDRTWIVITKDAGVKSPDHKLPLICREWGITHVVFTGGIIGGGYAVQKQALAAVWPQLFLLHRLPPGTQVKLGQVQRKGNVAGYELRVGGRSLSAVLREIG
jgi:hypothetical protein